MGTSAGRGTIAAPRSPAGSLRALLGRVGPALRATSAACLVRAGEATAVVLALATLVFLALRLLPGDPAALILGDQASAEELAALRARLHFDEPLIQQYARFLRGLATLDLGDSLRRPGHSAVARVAAVFPNTAALAAVGVTLGTCFGVAAAVLAAGPWLGRHRRWVDRALVVTASTPLLAFAPLLTLLLAVRLRVVPLPGDPDAGAAGLLFAGGLLAIPLGAQVGRIARASFADLARAPFLTVAAAKGAGPARIWFLHAVPAAVGPIVTVVAAQLGALLGGAVVLERLFERAGLGTLILEAYASRDVPVLEAAVIAGGVLFVATQSLGAVVHAAVDPRVGR